MPLKRCKTITMPTFLQKTLTIKTNFCKKKFGNKSQPSQYTPTGLKWRGTPISGKSKGGKCNQKTPLSAAPLLFYCQSCIAWNPQTFLHWTPKNPKKSFGRWSDSCSKTIEKLTGYDIFRIEIYSALGRTLHHKNFMWFFFHLFSDKK